MKKYLQIIGGTHRGQKIAFDHNDALRPTSGKLKEILFNWIQFEIEDAHCLDLFSGSGSLAFEALSRGAASLTVIEKNKKCYLNIINNNKLFKFEDRFQSYFLDAFVWIKRNELTAFDFIFIDPPFDKDYVTKILKILAEHKNLKSSCKIYIEMSKRESFELPNNFSILKEKKLGEVKAYLIKNED